MQAISTQEKTHPQSKQRSVTL